MPTRKRSFADATEDAAEMSPLKRLRGMWQFANLVQWIYTFGKAARIDDSIDVEEIEAACLNTQSTVLNDIGLALLKLISSHRGLTHDIFDSQARKQFLERDPIFNPFGTEESPTDFREFDMYTKVRVLQQMTQWTMIYPERIREKMEEQRDIDQTSWVRLLLVPFKLANGKGKITANANISQRIEPYGWDSDDRTYFVLDDNRVYRLTEAPPAPPPPRKPKSKKRSTQSGRRSSKRQRLVTNETGEGSPDAQVEDAPTEPHDDGLGGMTWECLAVTLNEVRELLEGFRRTRDENEKILRQQLEDHLVPILEQQEESMKRKALQRERELLNLAKMANAKRSSRIANKAEQRKQEEKSKEELLQQQQAEEARRKEDEARLKRERERDFRMASRGRRLKEREARRHHHEEELAQLSEDSRRMGDGEGRSSGRRLEAEIERKRQALKAIADEDEDWIFDCSCGLYGQVDDGAHSVACEECNVWQHSECLGIKEDEAERPEFHFICNACRRQKEEAKSRPRSTIKLKVHRSVTSPSQEGHLGGSLRAKSNDRNPIAYVFSKESEISLKSNTATTFPSIYPMLQNGTSKWAWPSSTPALEAAVHQTPQEPSRVAGSNGEITSRSAFSTSNTSAQSAQSANLVGHDMPPSGSQLNQPMAVTPSVSQRAAQWSTPSSISTPAISRDICRPVQASQDNLPSQPGLSPIKTSPQSSFASNGSSGTTPGRIPPGINLSPTQQEVILTPPTKHT